MIPNTLFNMLVILLLSSSFLSGCASTGHKSDPFENYNRGAHAFNHDMDRAVLQPMAEVYKTIVPTPVHRRVTNFFSNLDDVIVVANDLLQFKFAQAGSDAARFFVNTTVGILGLFDVATDAGLPKHQEDFGQTLGYWGMPSGPYLVLPFFGPSTVRDTPGRVVDWFFDPRTYYTSNTTVRNFVIGTNVIRAVDKRVDLLEVEQVVNAAATDQYTYIRDAYLQRREYLVNDGKSSPSKAEEDLFDDLKPNKPKPATPNAK